jgi:hypothetical protein
MVAFGGCGGFAKASEAETERSRCPVRIATRKTPVYVYVCVCVCDAIGCAYVCGFVGIMCACVGTKEQEVSVTCDRCVFDKC